MNITVVGLADCLDLAVLVCPDLVPDVHRVSEAIAQSLDELEQALRPHRARAKRPPTARAARPKPDAHDRGRRGRGAVHDPH